MRRVDKHVLVPDCQSGARGWRGCIRSAHLSHSLLVILFVYNDSSHCWWDLKLVETQNPLYSLNNRAREGPTLWAPLSVGRPWVSWAKKQFTLRLFHLIVKIRISAVTLLSSRYSSSTATSHMTMEKRSWALFRLTKFMLAACFEVSCSSEVLINTSLEGDYNLFNQRAVGTMNNGEDRQT